MYFSNKFNSSPDKVKPESPNPVLHYPNLAALTPSLFYRGLFSAGPPDISVEKKDPKEEEEAFFSCGVVGPCSRKALIAKEPFFLSHWLFRHPVIMKSNEVTF